MKVEEWKRYRRQAGHTLNSARRDLGAGDHDWSCFKAQQSAELAVKGFIRATREFVIGHSVTRLLGSLGEEPPEFLVDCARKLDKVYIPARYPDVYDSGAPLDYFVASDAQEAIECAERVLEWLDDRSSGESA